MPSVAARLQAGERFGSLVVEATIAVSPAASVYRVVEPVIGRAFALKVLSLTAPALVERSRGEARLLGALAHPNLVRSYGLREAGGRVGHLMELAEGPDLDGLLAGGRLPIGEALAIFRGILEGVAYVHGRGILHRDLKPGNVLLERGRGGWRPKVADFGLAKMLGEGGLRRHLTYTGATLGTYGYMAPEQAGDARRAGARADIFSLGCLLYHMVCGLPPFPGRGPGVLAGVRRGIYRDPAAAVSALPPPVADAIRACLAPSPMDRPASCEALARTLYGAGASGAGSSG